jgi:hypothetical protein
VAILGYLRDRMAALTRGSGFQDEGARGPLGLIVLSFTVDPNTGRAAAAAAGHGPVVGWTLAIIGDMFYFAVLMASTLWLSEALGNQQTTVGLVLLGMFVIQHLVQRRRSRPAAPAASLPIPTSPNTSLPTAAPPSPPRRARRTKRSASSRKRR